MPIKYTISVIVPAYNREKTIKRCLDSIFNQTYPAFEIIMVDDGSKDNTLDIIKRNYGDSVKIIRQNHKGAQAARNAGIRAAAGEYIAFLDSDDEWVPEKLEIQIAELEKNKDAVIYSDGFIQTDWTKEIPKVYDGKGTDTRNIKPGRKRIFRMNGKKGYVYKEILKESFCMFQSMLTSKKNLVEIGYLDEEVPSYQEWDTAIRLAENHEFIYTKKPLFVYHLHDGETISKDGKRDIDGVEYISEKHKYKIMCQWGSKGLAERYKLLMKKCAAWKDKRLVKYFLKYIMAEANVFILK